MLKSAQRIKMERIGHIFNKVKPKDKQSFIDTQPFEIKYWKKNINWEVREDVTDDFSKKYYHALVPIEDRSVISKYDNEKLNRLVDSLGNDLLLISGDFWGIQKFIFDGVTTSKASKILRSRSAMVQLITYAVVDRIKQEFKGSEALLFGAGKFMILAKNENHHKIKNIQKELDSYFLKNFFGQNGFILSTQTTTRDKIESQKESMEEDLNALGAKNEENKLNKFDLLNVEDDDILIDPFKNSTIDDNNSCKFCNKRIATKKIHKNEDEKACSICFNQIELGKELVKNNYISIFTSSNKLSKDIEIIQLNNIYYYAKFSKNFNNLNGDIFDITIIDSEYFDYPKWSLKSDIATDKEEIKSFNEYIEKDGKVISSGLMALKADIDKLGDTFRELYREDFRLFNRLSREVEFFFSNYITHLISKRDNIYTVFAGGDDLFLIGEYKEIIELAKEIREEFLTFSLGKTTISMGVVMFKPTTPINFVSEMADRAERRAKIERDSIDIFGVSMRFKEFNDIEDDFNKIVEFLEKERDDKTTFYYKLIELCDMRERLDNKEQFNPQDALWKSKLNYLFRRNVKQKDNDSKIFTKLNNLIEKGEKFKPSIFLQIYKNRDKKKEKRDD